MLLVIIGTAVFVAGSVSLGIPPPEGYGAPRVAPVQVAGVVLFVLLICFILVVSDDITAVFARFSYFASLRAIATTRLIHLSGFGGSASLPLRH